MRIRCSISGFSTASAAASPQFRSDPPPDLSSHEIRAAACGRRLRIRLAPPEMHSEQRRADEIKERQFEQPIEHEQRPPCRKFCGHCGREEDDFGEVNEAERGRPYPTLRHAPEADSERRIERDGDDIVGWRFQVEEGKSSKHPCASYEHGGVDDDARSRQERRNKRDQDQSRVESDDEKIPG